MALLWLVVLLPLASSQAIYNRRQAVLTPSSQRLALDLLQQGQLPSVLQNTSSDLKLLYARLVASLAVADVASATNSITTWITQLNPDGSFSDIDYKNQDRALSVYPYDGAC